MAASNENQYQNYANIYSNTSICSINKIIDYYYYYYLFLSYVRLHSEFGTQLIAIN